MNVFTVLGACGFIGSHLAERLREANVKPSCPSRDEDLSGKNLGKVIFCIGLTGDFRARPFDTVTAHVCRLVEILQQSLLRTLARECVARGYARFEWSVLDWNTPAIDFYEAAGAVGMQEWTVHRLTGQALHDFAT